MNSSSVAVKAVESKRPSASRVAERERSTARLFAWGLGALALAAMVSILWATGSHGTGVSADSVTYLNATRTLLRGEGLVDFDEHGRAVALTHYPPLFPVAVAGAAALLRIDALAAARWLNAGLFGATILLLGLGCRKRLPGDYWTLFVTLMAAVSVPLVVDHLYALSEPLFLFLSLAALFALMRHLETGSPAQLALTACWMAAALLTRYAGVAVVGAGALSVLGLSQDSWLARLRRATVLGAMAVLPLGIWVVVRSSSSVARKASLQPGLHVPPLGIFASGAQTLAYWIVPAAVPLALALGLLGVTVAILGFLLAQNRAALRLRTLLRLSHAGTPVLPAVFVLFIAAYCLVLLAGRTFAFEDIIFDDRTLSVLLMPGAAVTAWAMANAGARERKLATALLGIAIVFTASNVLRSGRFLLNTRNRGLGYMSALWTASPVVESVRHLPAGVSLYSNLPSAVRFLSRRDVAPVPVTHSLHTGEPNPEYSQQVDDLRQRVKAGSAVVACFAVSPPNPACASLSQLEPGVKVESEDSRGFLVAGSSN